MTAKGWSRRFEDPLLPDGRQLRTLREAATHILVLPKREAAREHWQIAMEFLIMTAEGRRPLMFADIAMKRALNHGAPDPDPAPRRRRAKAYRIIR